VAYKNVKYAKIDESFFADVACGILQSPQSWTKILRQNLERPSLWLHFARKSFLYENIYSSLSKLLGEFKSVLDDKSKEFHSDVAFSFAQILIYRWRCTNEDLKRLFKFPLDTETRNVCVNLASRISLPKISGAVFLAIFEEFLKEKGNFGHQSVIALIRSLEATADPAVAVKKSLSTLDNLENNDFLQKAESTGFWYFAVILIRRGYSFEAHEKTLQLIHRYFLLRCSLPITKKTFDSLALCHLLLLLNTKESQLVSNPNQLAVLRGINTSILECIEQGELKYTFLIDDHILTALLLYALEQGRNSEDIKWSKLLTSAVKTMKILYSQRTSPAKISKISDLDFWGLSYFTSNRHSQSLVFENIKKSTRSALIMASLIRDLHGVPRLMNHIKSLCEGILSETSLSLPSFGHRFFITEAVEKVQEKLPISTDLRDVLLSANFRLGNNPLFQIDQEIVQDSRLFDSIGEEYLIYCEERQDILEQTAKLFANGKFDSKLVKFATSLFYLPINHERLTDLYAVPTLVSLVSIKL
jgi:hypothetical protein